jgi:hypothetical protein
MGTLHPGALHSGGRRGPLHATNQTHPCPGPHRNIPRDGAQGCACRFRLFFDTGGRQHACVSSHARGFDFEPFVSGHEHRHYRAHDLESSVHWDECVRLCHAVGGTADRSGKPDQRAERMVSLLAKRGWSAHGDLDPNDQRSSALDGCLPAFMHRRRAGLFVDACSWLVDRLRQCPDRNARIVRHRRFQSRNKSAQRESFINHRHWRVLILRNRASSPSPSRCEQNCHRDM